MSKRNREVPFFRPSIGDREIDAVTKCMRSGWLTTGAQCITFENDFAKCIGGNVQTVAVNSATAALHLGLEALGIKEGDEVIVPTLTFTATAEVVRYLGATPVLVDIEDNSLCLDFDQVQRRINHKTAAIMPVHFAGKPVDIKKLRQVIGNSDIKILDDAAHAFPTSIREENIGNSGADVSAFSFYANKTVTTGEGGMLVTNSEEVADRARTMRLHGINRDVFNRYHKSSTDQTYDIIAPGFKYNLTDLAASIGIEQLKRRTQFRERRAQIAARYNSAFSNLPLQIPPSEKPNETHAWHLYVIQLNKNFDRDEFAAKLKSRGISTSIHYRPLHQTTYWSQFVDSETFPIADRYYSRCISLPIFPDMSDDEIQIVIDAVSQTFKQDF